MARLTILQYPDPRLRVTAQPVAMVDESIRQLAADMLETMYHAPGIGLAATQVNVHKRMVVIDISESRKEPHVLINPQILERAGAAEMEEGCLSVPGVFDWVERAERVVARCLDLDGNERQIEASGLLAVCIQHEIDHLEGRLFVDRLSMLKRSRIKKRFDKLSKQAL
jgi:peptide deformylase